MIMNSIQKKKYDSAREKEENVIRRDVREGRLRPRPRHDAGRLSVQRLVKDRVLEQDDHQAVL